MRRPRRFLYTFCSLRQKEKSFVSLRIFSFRLLPVSLILCFSCSTKQACSAVPKKCLRRTAQPLFRASGHKRYNTLDFASKVVCQQGCCSPLLDDPEPRGYSPLDTPLFFRMWPLISQTIVFKIVPTRSKIQNRREPYRIIFAKRSRRFCLF